MPTLISTGIGSGLDVNSIISSLMAVESRPLTLLQQAKTTLNTQLSSFGRLQSLTAALRDSASAVTSPSLWGQTTAKSQDSSAVTVSTASGAVAGSYAVSVQSLASAQTLSSSSFTSSASTLSAGTLTIELGSWVVDNSGPSPVTTDFTPKADATAITVDIDDASTSLASIRDKINAAGAGVTASIINDASGARLALRSSSTGAENAFRITAAETVDDGVNGTGLSALAFDARSASPMTRNQTAANAAATVNGIQVSSSSNTLEGVADGMTLNLLKTTSSDVEITVAADTEAVRTNINNFVKSFNDLAVYIRDQTRYDASAQSGGALQGDRVVGSLLTQLRGVINQATSASTSFDRLSDIGISMKSDGTLEVKSSQLDDALGNLPELKKLLATDGANSATSGFMDRFKDLAAAVLSSDGSLETRNASLKTLITRNDKSQAAMQTRLEKTEARLRAQYQALDASMANLNSLSSYLTGQLASLSGNGS